MKSQQSKKNLKTLREDKHFICPYCDKQFKSEAWYLKHNCTEMKRDEEVQSPIGILAFSLYREWLSTNRKLAPEIDTFLKSRFYTTFIRFAKFVNKVDLPDISHFIEWCNYKEYPPTMWLMPEVYGQYKVHLDLKYAPLKSVNLSLTTLKNYCDKNGVELYTVFDNIKPGELLDMLIRRKVTPWLLANSTKFWQMYHSRLSQEEKTHFNMLIHGERWKGIFEENKLIRIKIKELIKQLEL